MGLTKWEMNRRAMLRGFAASPLALLSCLPVAQAQINPFRGSRGTRLNKEDLAALGEATKRLLDRNPFVAGARESWSNPNSGASGSATAVSAAMHEGMACRVVHYDAVVPGPTPNRTATLTWCMTKDGWKVR